MKYPFFKYLYLYLLTYDDFKLKIMIFWTPILEYLKISYSKKDIQHISQAKCITEATIYDPMNLTVSSVLVQSDQYKLILT